jgi:hypothetical protein
MDDINLSKLNILASIQQTFPNDDLQLFDLKYKTASFASVATATTVNTTSTSHNSNVSKRFVNLLTPTNLKNSFNRHSSIKNKHQNNSLSNLSQTPIIASGININLISSLKVIFQNFGLKTF